ncbi:MAG: DUF4132 domain-containing protein [Actinomycetia bacterium]|nr:DUF4132 domain-containing protein [Actinomycetes bacterium]
MFEKMKAGLGLSAAPLPLINVLQVLKAESSSLYEGVVAYIAEGSDPQILSVVTKSPDPIRRLLGSNLGIQVWFWPDDQEKAVKKVVPGWDAGKQNIAMHKLMTKPSALTSEQWVRFGRFAAAYGSLDLKRLADVPPWLAHLTTAESRICGDKPWTADFVASLILADDVASEDVAALLFRVWVEGGVGYNSQLRPMPGAAERALQQPDTFMTAVAKASLEGKLNALDVVTSTPGLGERVPALLCVLAVASSKQVREKTLSVMSGLPEQFRIKVLEAALGTGSPANVGGVVDLLARSQAGRAVLEQRLPEASGKLADLIDAALRRADAVGAPVEMEVPLQAPPCQPLDTAPLGDEFDAQLLAAIPPWVERMRKDVADLKVLKSPYSWQKSNIKTFESAIAYASRMGAGDIQRLRDYLNGATQSPPEAVKQLGPVLRQVKGLGLLPAMRLTMQERKGRRYISWWGVSNYCDIDVDLRLLLRAATAVGVADPASEIAQLVFGWWGRDISPENKWPYLLEHPLLLEQVLGLRPSPAGRNYGDAGSVSEAIEILDTFPALPPQYVPRLAEIALGTGKTNRLEAQQLLARHTRAGLLAIRGLSDSSADVRASAAAWLGRLGDPDAAEELQARLRVERNEPVQAAILSALNRLGSDISSFLTPAALAAAAAKGLKGKPPTDMEWVPMLPAVRWADGAPVDADTIRWWATLAVKMKDPAGAGLIPIYVSLLDKESQQKLGSFVLDAWIAQDTRTATDEEARAYAAVEGPRRYQQYQDWYKRSKNDYTKERADRTPDQVLEEVRKEKMSEYLGSAISCKGLLALTCGAPGHHVLQAVQRYIRDHGQRRAQVEALITAASPNDDPAAIQLVLQVARRHKQATVQAKAVEFVEQIAERKGWTPDELADRTIPTAGFEDDGLLTLDYGPRQFVGRIGCNAKTGAYGIELSGADGKPVKALPAPASADDAELVKQARAQLTVSKKELKQVVDLQTARLFEAMCTSRTWDAVSWREDLFAHPVMKHLLSSLVWVQNPETPARCLFRPTVEGDLLDADDEAVTLADDARVGLAHASTMSEAEVAAWRTHLGDYKVTPLFGQFESGGPAFTPGATEITDHRGWLSDSFTIRGRATKRGYARSQAEDGGWFSEYFKTYQSVGIRVVISFTGSYVPEEQIAAAVTDLTFESGRSRTLTLDEVPPVLLAESYRDYIYVAEGGVFDPDWKNKAAF